MGRWKKTSKRSRAKTILRLPDLEQSKNAVLNSLAAASSQESYAHGIDEFIGWYCSEPRLALNRSVVLRYQENKFGKFSVRFSKHVHLNDPNLPTKYLGPCRTALGAAG